MIVIRSRLISLRARRMVFRHPAAPMSSGSSGPPWAGCSTVPSSRTGMPPPPSPSRRYPRAAVVQPANRTFVPPSMLWRRRRLASVGLHELQVGLDELQLVVQPRDPEDLVHPFGPGDEA